MSPQEKAPPLPKFDRSVSCLSWAYNEELLVEKYLIRLNRFLAETVEDYEIVIVNDGSTDRTAEIIRRLQKTIPRISLVENPQNWNVGISCRRAIQAAKKEFLFWQTLDWSYDISNLRVWLELLREYDIVAGSRAAGLLRSAGFWEGLKLFNPAHWRTRSDTVRKAFVSLTNYFLIRLLFQVPLTDFQNVVIYPTKLVQSISYESKSSFLNPEGLLKAYWRGAHIAEVPVSFIPRRLGEAKGTKLKAIRASVKDVFGLWFQWMVLGKRDKSPGVVKRPPVSRSGAADKILAEPVAR